MSNALPADHQLGANNPPAEIDPFIAGLEEKHEPLLISQAMLEREASRLPKEPASDDDVAAINAWVVKARKLGKQAEETRVEVKAPYLDRERKIDTWFGAVVKSLKARADTIEARNGPYLKAKAAAEKAAADARAAALREEAARLQREAEAAAQRQRDALAEEQRREQALRDEEAARQAAMVQAASAEGEAPSPVAPANTDTTAEAEVRQAAQQSHAASQDAERAAEAVRVANLAADRATAKADAGAGLGKVQGGGGSSRVTTVYNGRVVSWPKLIQSLGPLGHYFNESILQAAVDRAARADPRPEIPGVEYVPEDRVKTSASRK